MVGDFIALLLNLYFFVLVGRLVFDWVQVFSRDWRPKGPVLVLANGVYALTDPPLRALRRVIGNQERRGRRSRRAFRVACELARRSARGERRASSSATRRVPPS